MLCVSANKYVRVRGKKIAEFRARAGLSQEALAVAIGASKGGVYNIERADVANVYLAKRRKLIDALGITDAVFEKEIVCHDPRPIALASTKASPRLPRDENLKLVDVLRDVASSTSERRGLLLGYLSHAECRTLRDSLAARLKKPDVPQRGRLRGELLPLIDEKTVAGQ